MASFVPYDYQNHYGLMNYNNFAYDYCISDFDFLNIIKIMFNININEYCTNLYDEEHIYDEIINELRNIYEHKINKPLLLFIKILFQYDFYYQVVYYIGHLMNLNLIHLLINNIHSITAQNTIMNTFLQNTQYNKNCISFIDNYALFKIKMIYNCPFWLELIDIHQYNLSTNPNQNYEYNIQNDEQRTNIQNCDADISGIYVVTTFDIPSLSKNIINHNLNPEYFDGTYFYSISICEYKSKNKPDCFEIDMIINDNCNYDNYLNHNLDNKLQYDYSSITKLTEFTQTDIKLHNVDSDTVIYLLQNLPNNTNTLKKLYYAYKNQYKLLKIIKESTIFYLFKLLRQKIYDKYYLSDEIICNIIKYI